MADKKIFWVDIPDPLDLDSEESAWVNVATCDTREDAIQYIRDHIDTTSQDGTINLISEGVSENGLNWTKDEKTAPVKAVPEATEPEPGLAELIEIAKALLEIHEDDIETGIEDGTYEEEDNIETRAFIQRAHTVIDAADRSKGR